MWDLSCTSKSTAIAPIINKFSNKKLLAIGDSIVWGAGSASGNKSWLAYLPDLLGLSTTFNYGVIGNQICNMYDRLISDTQLQADANSSDIIILSGGMNDFRHNVPIGTMTDRTTASFYGRLHLIIKELITRYPTKAIFTLAPINMGQINNADAPTVVLNSTGDSVINGNGNMPLDIANAMKNVSQFYSLPCLDLYANSGIYPFSGQGTLYMNDLLHPNDAGYQYKLAPVIAQFIKSVY